MCGTMVALGNATVDGSVLFAKNSDREPNEAQELVFVPAADFEDGDQVACTYVSIPQVPHTHAVLLARPYWIWGAEMGANEHGVVIGNEAVFSKVPAGKEPGLIGMDFLRLGLERGATARQALDVITSLLVKYGQSGNCGHTHGLYYHNSYLIADPEEAWVLETVDRMWIAEKVRDVRSISNGFTIRREWDLASDDVVDYAIEKGWCRSAEEFDFAACYADFIFTRFSFSGDRHCRTLELLDSRKGQLREEDMMAILRDHGSKADTHWTPAGGLAKVSVCWHAGPGPIRNSQSVGSMVSRLTRDEQTHWLTGTSAPCTSIFKPVWMDAGLPDLGDCPEGTYSNGSLWWQHETMHREVLRDFAARLPLVKEEQGKLEKGFLERVHALEGAPAEARRALSRQCFHEADRLHEELQPRIASAPLRRRLPLLYAISWQTFNRKAGLANTQRVREVIQQKREQGLFARQDGGATEDED